MKTPKKWLWFATFVFWCAAGCLAVGALDAATTISLHTSVTLPVDL